jgi:putative Mg2+ transporter-C (MgtC) family protein
MPTTEDLIMMLRVLIAFLLGGLVGWERERVQRPAGLRTHMLVAAGAACFTVASIYGFDGLGTSRDPARLAAQIVSGIGFLGAGVIFRSQGAVRGLTTAASIWMVSALGVLSGLGLYWVAAFATMLTWFILRVLKSAERIGSRPAPPPLVDNDEDEASAAPATTRRATSAQSPPPYSAPQAPRPPDSPRRTWR